MFKGFSEEQLDAAFGKVADPRDWRNPIYEVVDRDVVAVTVAAIEFFTATTVTVKDLDWNDEFMVQSVGYRMGPAGA